MSYVPEAHKRTLPSHDHVHVVICDGYHDGVHVCIIVIIIIIVVVIVIIVVVV